MDRGVRAVCELTHTGPGGLGEHVAPQSSASRVASTQAGRAKRTARHQPRQLIQIGTKYIVSRRPASSASRLTYMGDRLNTRNKISFTQTFYGSLVKQGERKQIQIYLSQLPYRPGVGVRDSGASELTCKINTLTLGQIQRHRHLHFIPQFVRRWRPHS